MSFLEYWPGSIVRALVREAWEQGYSLGLFGVAFHDGTIAINLVQRNGVQNRLSLRYLQLHVLLLHIHFCIL